MNKSKKQKYFYKIFELSNWFLPWWLVYIGMHCIKVLSSLWCYYIIDDYCYYIIDDFIRNKQKRWHVAISKTSFSASNIKSKTKVCVSKDIEWSNARMQAFRSMNNLEYDFYSFSTRSKKFILRNVDYGINSVSLVAILFNFSP